MFSLDPITVGFFIAIISSIILSILVIYRLREEKAQTNEKIGCFIAGAPVITTFICILFFPFLMHFLQSTTSYIVSPIYTATIVDVKSYTSISANSRGSGNNFMHIAIVEFTDKNGKKIRADNNLSSGDEPKIGEKITISYNNGTLQEVSFTAFAIIIGLSLLLILLGFCLTLIINYALYKKNDTLLRRGAKTLVYIILPLVVLIFFIVLTYSVIQYFLGNNPQMTGFIAGLFIFFCISLLIVIITYIMMFFKKK